MQCRYCDTELSGYNKVCDSCKEARKKYCVGCGVELKGHGNPVRCRGCANAENRERGCYDNMFTEDVLRRKSESMKKTCSDPEYRANMSCLRKIDWEEGKYDDAHIALSKALKAAHARGCYDGVQGNPSKLELEVLAEFRLFGVEAVGQYRPDGCSFVYDIYLPEYQTLVEVDGEYWHYSEMAKEKGVAKHDDAKDDWALSNGFDIMRLPEIALRDQGVVESVDTALGMLT